MLRFEWNALRVGDRVAVHDDTSSRLSLTEGAVSVVQRRSVSGKDVGIRMNEAMPATTAGAARTVFPRRHAVHLLPLDPTETCWRCDSIGARAAGSATRS